MLVPWILTVSEYVQFSPAWRQSLLPVPSVANSPQRPNTPLPWGTSSHSPLNCNSILPNQPSTFCVHTWHPLAKMVQSCPGCQVLSYSGQLVVLPEVDPLQEWVGQKGPHPKHWVGAGAAAGDVEWSPNFIIQFLLDRFKIMLFLSLLYQLVQGWGCGTFIQRALLSFGGEYSEKKKCETKFDRMVLPACYHIVKWTNNQSVVQLRVCELPWHHMLSSSRQGFKNINMINHIFSNGCCCKRNLFCVQTW